MGVQTLLLKFRPLKQILEKLRYPSRQTLLIQTGTGSPTIQTRQTPDNV